MDSAYLVPLHVDEVLPGDTVKYRPSWFVRLTTPERPFMDGLYFDWQAFFVPARQVWTNFVKMMGERVDPADHNDYVMPTMSAPASVGHAVGSLSDYFGIPTEVPLLEHISLLHRCYAHIWNTWYRDADLQDSAVVDLDDGPDDPADYPLQKRGKRKDYLTGARPFAQRGDAVELPLGTSAPVTLTDGTIDGNGDPTFLLQGNVRTIGQSGATAAQWSGSGTDASATWSDPALVLGDLTGTADLTSATAATINTIRQALATQHVLERDARGGGRYWEVVGAHFNVFPDHIRLQRPELLATGSVPIQVQQVASTTYNAASSQSRVGVLGAYAVAAQVGRGFVKSFDEHGYIMVLGSVRAELTYQQGLPRMFSRSTRFDFFWPDYQGLGEQAVLSKEIFADASANDDDVWGYVPRFEEYRRRQSFVSGEFRSSYTASLDVWHLALDFATRPVLNAAFIEEAPPVSRVLLSGSTAAEVMVDSFHKQTYVRPMARFGTPGLTRF